LLYGGIKKLAEDLRSSQILHDTGQFGALGTVLKAAIDEQSFQILWMQAPNQEAKDALQLKKYIEEIQKFIGKPVEDIFWMGMPKNVIQFIAILQQKVADVSENFEMPPFNEDYLFIMDIDNLGRDLLQQIANLGIVGPEGGVKMSDIHKIINDHVRLTMQAATMPTHTWDVWCKMAGQPHISQMITPLEKNMSNFLAMEAKGPTAPGKPAQPLIVRSPAEQAPKITSANLEKLESFVVRNAINEITVEDVGILIDAAGPVVEQVPGGVEDVYKFYISTLFLKEIERIKDARYTEFSLRMVPTASLLKLVTIRFDTHDIFDLEYFGHLLYRDRKDQSKAMNVHYADKAISIVAPKNHVWSEIVSMTDLATVMTGLADAAELLLHKTILSGDEIRKLLKKFQDLYDLKAGVASVSRMKQVLKQRLSERATALRQIANGQTSVLRPLHELRNSSADLYGILTGDADAALQVMRVTRDLGGGTGETRVGRKRHNPRGYGPLGKTIDYFRPKKPSQTENEKDKESDEVRPPPTCAKCGVKGHKLPQCKKSWCPLSKLPAQLKALGKRKREEAKVDLETGKPAKKQA